MADVKPATRKALVLNAVEALVLLLVIPILLWRLGVKYLPSQWEGGFICAYFGALVLWGAVRKSGSARDTLSALEVKAEDPQATALDMMADLRGYLSSSSSADDWRVPRMVKLVHGKMLAESIARRVNDGGSKC